MSRDLTIDLILEDRLRRTFDAVADQTSAADASLVTPSAIAAPVPLVTARRRRLPRGVGAGVAAAAVVAAVAAVGMARQGTSPDRTSTASTAAVAQEPPTTATTTVATPVDPTSEVGDVPGLPEWRVLVDTALSDAAWGQQKVYGYWSTVGPPPVAFTTTLGASSDAPPSASVSFRAFAPGQYSTARAWQAEQAQTPGVTGTPIDGGGTLFLLDGPLRTASIVLPQGVVTVRASDAGGVDAPPLSAFESVARTLAASIPDLVR